MSQYHRCRIHIRPMNSVNRTPSVMHAVRGGIPPTATPTMCITQSSFYATIEWNSDLGATYHHQLLCPVSTPSLCCGPSSHLPCSRRSNILHLPRSLHHHKHRVQHRPQSRAAHPSRHSRRPRQPIRHPPVQPTVSATE